MRRIALLLAAFAAAASADTTTLSVDPLRNNGDCEFEEMQLASDGAIELRSLEMGERVTPNRTMNGTVHAGEFHYYHLCILRHAHEHAIFINLTTSYTPRVSEGDANLFLSSLDKYPRMGHAAWISQRPGNDFAKLYTYLDGFPRKSDAQNRSLALHIGVVGVDARAHYNLTVSVRDLPINSDITSREQYYTRLHKQQQRANLRRRRP